ncbi:hypothetical protein D3C71_894210 [compost metagenome]
MKADNTNAGYNPANSPVIRIKPIRENHIVVSENEKAKGLSKILLNIGTASMVNVIAHAPEIKVSNIDSIRNWLTRLERCAPATFRTATSLALF